MTAGLGAAYALTMHFALNRCECTGACGRRHRNGTPVRLPVPGWRCPAEGRDDIPGGLLHAVPDGPDGHMKALCAACHAGIARRDHQAARTAVSPPEDGLWPSGDLL